MGICNRLIAKDMLLSVGRGKHQDRVPQKEKHAVIYKTTYTKGYWKVKENFADWRLAGAATASIPSLRGRSWLALRC
jgi:hypothetical protein